jgi:uncharacterized protein with PIN domain
MDQSARFICDEMLGRLARWLRAAGYDAEDVSPGASDREVIARAVADDRLVLTRDRKFLEFRGAATKVFLVVSGDVEVQAREIAAALGIDWLRAPFSRCLVDNGLLLPAPKDDLQRLPEGRLDIADPIMTCPACGRLYWSGGHVRRMRSKLEKWAQRN